MERGASPGFQESDPVTISAPDARPFRRAFRTLDATPEGKRHARDEDDHDQKEGNDANHYFILIGGQTAFNRQVFDSAVHGL